MSDSDGLDQLLSQMEALQAGIAAAEEESARTPVTGSAGGGIVTVELSGEYSLDSVHIDPAVVAQGDASVLEDLVLAAVRDGIERLAERRRGALSGVVGQALGSLFSDEQSAGFPLAGFGLPTAPPATSGPGPEGTADGVAPPGTSA